MKTRIYIVDAFTDTPFSGNPACVSILSEPKDDHWMQQVAFEMNLSETAFLQKRDDGFDLRWFTPKTEVDLCGHATLASAHIIWETGVLPPEEKVTFFTRSGVLTAEKKDKIIELGFPALYARPEEFSPELLDAFGINPIYAGMFDEKHLFEVESEEIVTSLNPDFNHLKKLKGRGVVITAASSSGKYDFVSRYFAPWVGVYEDPVTGSSHCCLATHWSKRLEKQELKAYQASPRGGYLTTKVVDNRVLLGGQAVTILAGELLV
ncbi:PhzF family phenazine biosynthesis protein [bacterium]|nr:PhzF family phenazine biosynthesis protein [bacterium]